MHTCKGTAHGYRYFGKTSPHIARWLSLIDFANDGPERDSVASGVRSNQQHVPPQPDHSTPLIYKETDSVNKEFLLFRSGFFNQNFLRKTIIPYS